MQEINYNDYLKEVMDNLPGGAFLTVRDKDNRLNTMTIGWGTVGYIWGTPIFISAVRDSRYTYNLIENSNNFTVSVPEKGKMKDELKFCGSKSGRNYDKFAECNLNTIPARNIESPFIAGCKIHYECKIRFKQAMDKNNLIPAFDDKWYQDNDYHTFYFGEIITTFLENHNN